MEIKKKKISYLICCCSFYRWVDLLLSNSNLIDYVYTILRDKRVSLNDPIILTFIELYFPKVSVLIYLSLKEQEDEEEKEKRTQIVSFSVILMFQVSLLNIDRLIESICQTLNSKENYEEICGDLLALCVMTQKGVRIPAFTLREMKRCLQSFYLRFKDKFSALEGNILI